MKIISNLAALILLPMMAQAQATPVDDFFNSTGKIYVVVGVVFLLFLGIVAFLVYLERKISRIERDMEA